MDYIRKELQSVACCSLICLRWQLNVFFNLSYFSTGRMEFWLVMSRSIFLFSVAPVGYCLLLVDLDGQEGLPMVRTFLLYLNLHATHLAFVV